LRPPRLAVFAGLPTDSYSTAAVPLTKKKRARNGLSHPQLLTIRAEQSLPLPSKNMPRVHYRGEAETAHDGYQKQEDTKRRKQERRGGGSGGPISRIGLTSRRIMSHYAI